MYNIIKHDVVAIVYRTMYYVQKWIEGAAKDTVNWVEGAIKDTRVFFADHPVFQVASYTARLHAMPFDWSVPLPIAAKYSKPSPEPEPEPEIQYNDAFLKEFFGNSNDTDVEDESFPTYSSIPTEEFEYVDRELFNASSNSSSLNVIEQDIVNEDDALVKRCLDIIDRTVRVICEKSNAEQRQRGAQGFGLERETENGGLAEDEGCSEGFIENGLKPLFENEKLIFGMGLIAVFILLCAVYTVFCVRHCVPRKKCKRCNAMKKLENQQLVLSANNTAIDYPRFQPAPLEPSPPTPPPPSPDDINVDPSIARTRPKPSSVGVIVKQPTVADSAV